MPFCFRADRALLSPLPLRRPLKKAKRKGLQLALEPLDGRGIAGYVPEP
jgi:hypothetical protein